MDLSGIRFEIQSGLPGPVSGENRMPWIAMADQFPLEIRNFLCSRRNPAITTVWPREKRQDWRFMGRQVAECSKFATKPWLDNGVRTGLLRRGSRQQPVEMFVVPAMGGIRQQASVDFRRKARLPVPTTTNAKRLRKFRQSPILRRRSKSGESGIRTRGPV